MEQNGREMEQPSKEEILARSRRENRGGDERERTVRIQGESFSLIFVLLMGLVLLTWKRVHGLPGGGRADHVLDRLCRQPDLSPGPAAKYVRYGDPGNLPCFFGV